MNGYFKWLLHHCCDGFCHILKGISNNYGTSEKGPENSKPGIPVTSASGSSGNSRAGLFRTPISGGVQSATSAHGLPRPALAVRNLMEQVHFDSGSEL